MNGIMKRTHRTPICLLLIASLTVNLLREQVSACPFCLSPPQTWSEILAGADVVVVGELVGRELFDHQIVTESSSRTQFRIVKTVKAPGDGHDRLRRLRFRSSTAASQLQTQNAERPLGPCELLPGRTTTIQEYVTGKPGDLFLLSGRRCFPLSNDAVTTFETSDAAPATSTSITPQESPADATSVPLRFDLCLPSGLLQWDSPAALNSQLLPYLLNAPDNDIPQSLRLTYFVPFLESSDAEIAADAWGEFARSQYEDVVAVRHLLSREKIRSWIARPEIGPERLGLYGMLLGLCGTADDAEFLRQQIGEPRLKKSKSTEFRFGIEGLMGGLLLLTGESGLDYLDSSRLQNSEAASEEQFAVVSALQYMWSYESTRIAPARLRQSLRLLLDNPEMREIIIADLARWQDWQSAPVLISRFSSESADEGTRRAIVQFMIALTREAERAKQPPVRTVSNTQTAESNAISRTPVDSDLLQSVTQFLDQVRVSHPQMIQSAMREFGPAK